MLPDPTNSDFDIGLWLEKEAIPLIDLLDEQGRCGLLSKRQQAIFLMWTLLGEVGNGGAEQYFFNCGHLVKDTVDVLEWIGARKTASHLVALAAFYPGGFPETDVTESRQAYDAFARDVLPSMRNRLTSS